MTELDSENQMLTKVQLHGQSLVASIVGEIDLHNSPELRGSLMELLERHPVGRLVLDLSGVPYMDSSAIAVMVELLQKMRKTGGKVYLVAPQKRVRGLLEIARLDTIFGVVATTEEALKH